MEPRRVEPRRVEPRRVEPRRVGGTKGGGHEGWRPEGWKPEISRFFFTLPPQFSNVHIWSSRAVVCEPRRPGLVGPSGFHTTAREPKRAHLRVPVFKNTTKIQRKGPTREGEKNKNCGGGRGKIKSEILGGPAEGGSGGGGGPAEGVRQRGPQQQQQQHNNNNNKKTTFFMEKTKHVKMKTCLQKKKNSYFQPTPRRKGPSYRDPSQKKGQSGWGLTFPNVKNDAGKHKSKKVCVFLKASPDASLEGLLKSKGRCPGV